MDVALWCYTWMGLSSGDRAWLGKYRAPDGVNKIGMTIWRIFVWISNIKFFGDLLHCLSKRISASLLISRFVWPAYFFVVATNCYKTHFTWKCDQCYKGPYDMSNLSTHVRYRRWKSSNLNPCKAWTALLCVLPSHRKTTSLDSSLLKSYSFGFTTRVWTGSSWYRRWRALKWWCYSQSEKTKVFINAVSVLISFKVYIQRIWWRSWKAKLVIWVQWVSS